MLQNILQAIQFVDEQMILWIQEYMLHPILTKIMVFVSTLGNKGMIWIVLGILFLCFGIRQKKLFHIGIRLFLCLGTTALLCNVVLKPLVARIRPYDVLGFPILVPPLADYSFPSGHTSASFAAATAIYAYHKKWGIVAYAFAGCMGFSRLYLGVHFPSDVLVGGLLGFLMANITLWICRKYDKMSTKEKIERRG